MGENRPIQYNIAIRVIDSRKEWFIQTVLANHGGNVFTDSSGNLDRTGFYKECLPYVGEVVVIKTLKSEAADTAQRILRGLDKDLVVLPTTQCPFEENRHPELRGSYKSVATLVLR